MILIQDEVELKEWKQDHGAQVIRAFVPLIRNVWICNYTYVQEHKEEEFTQWNSSHYEEVPKSIQEHNCRKSKEFKIIHL